MNRHDCTSRDSCPIAHTIRLMAERPCAGCPGPSDGVGHDPWPGGYDADDADESNTIRKG